MISALYSKRIADLHVEVRGAIDDIFKTLDKEGLKAPWKPWLTSTLRNPQEQLNLYKQGRELVADGHGLLVYRQVGVVATWALPWQSAHCFGLAGDIALVRDSDNHWLENDDPTWNRIGELVALNPRLEWGGSWKKRDRAHIQLRGWDKQDWVRQQSDRLRELWLERSNSRTGR